jgi:ATP-dependent DNA helicase RecG
MKLTDPVDSLTGVGSKLYRLYKRLHIDTIEDLIYFYPRRYDDYSLIVKIADIKPGPLTLKVKIKSVNQRYARRGLHITEALVNDSSGSLKIIWFNQPYRATSLKSNSEYYISGLYDFQGNRYSMLNPSVELVSSFPKNTARIVPIYPETKGLKSYQIRRSIKHVLPLISQLPETLPRFIVNGEHFMSHAKALEQLHFPESSTNYQKAKERLGFEELYEINLAALMNKQQNASEISPKFKFDEALARSFVKQLNFKLTDAQRISAWQILKDLDKPTPMNRMLEGDVGSGKTVVAILGALMVVKQGYQVAYMAPTEILARQQYTSLIQMLKPFNLKVGLLIAAMAKKEQRLILRGISSGRIDIVVGTHSLIQSEPKFKDLALIIIDEQHRFGVAQREKLMSKAKQVPHVLTMTATPIPRSLALTVYGELDVSIINELPSGRKPIITKVISPKARMSMYISIDKQIEQGRQIYVVCPLIDESDTLGVRSVTQEFKRLKEEHFSHRSIALIHGRLKSAEKEKIMENFSAGQVDILVSTTVVEVGVNVVNATVMLVEGAERFGLAQLHQLRGRVGRSQFQSYCYLVPSTGLSVPNRLNAMESTHDGFKLAELDLKMRGPGEIYGARQHGALDLRLANISDTKLVTRARVAASSTLEKGIDLLQYPRLKSRIENLRKITNLN